MIDYIWDHLSEMRSFHGVYGLGCKDDGHLRYTGHESEIPFLPRRVRGVIALIAFGMHYGQSLLRYIHDQ